MKTKSSSTNHNQRDSVQQTKTNPIDKLKDSVHSITSSITSRRSQVLREVDMLPPDHVVLPANRYILRMRQKVIEAAIPWFWLGGAVGAVPLLGLAVVEGSNSLGLDLHHLLGCEGCDVALVHFFSRIIMHTSMSYINTL